jgi:hypothetical protein
MSPDRTPSGLPSRMRRAVLMIRAFAVLPGASQAEGTGSGPFEDPSNSEPPSGPNTDSSFWSYNLSGRDLADSQKLIIEAVSPILPANCACVRPQSFRLALIRSLRLFTPSSVSSARNTRESKRLDTCVMDFGSRSSLKHRRGAYLLRQRLCIVSRPGGT